MENNKSLYEVSYEIRQLMKEKEDIKKALINNIITETSQVIFKENNEKPLSARELERILKDFYHDLNNVIQEVGC